MAKINVSKLRILLRSQENHYCKYTLIVYFMMLPELSLYRMAISVEGHMALY